LGQDVYRWGCEVFAVEGEKKRPARLLPIDEAMLRESVQRIEDPAMRGAPREAGDLAAGERAGRAGEHAQHPAIERGANCGVRTRQIHLSRISSIWRFKRPYGA
jgi:hypothetical protein